MKWLDGFWTALPSLNPLQQVTALAGIVFVLLFLVVMMVLKYRSAEGRERRRRKEDREAANNTNAISILQEMLQEMREELDVLKDEVGELRVKDTANGLLIQAHTAREQILSMGLDNAVIIIQRLIEQLPPGSVTQDLRDQAARILPARELLRGVPLPGMK